MLSLMQQEGDRNCTAPRYYRKIFIHHFNRTQRINGFTFGRFHQLLYTDLIDRKIPLISDDELLDLYNGRHSVFL